jgi:Tfp pilus assembly protein PilO
MNKENWLKIVLVIVILLTLVFMLTGLNEVYYSEEVEEVDLKKVIEESVKDTVQTSPIMKKYRTKDGILLFFNNDIIY